MYWLANFTLNFYPLRVYLCTTIEYSTNGIDIRRSVTTKQYYTLYSIIVGDDDSSISTWYKFNKIGNSMKFSMINNYINDKYEGLSYINWTDKDSSYSYLRELYKNIPSDILSKTNGIIQINYEKDIIKSVCLRKKNSCYIWIN